MKCHLFLDLKATECNGWPRLEIKLNEKNIFNEFIVSNQLISLELDCISYNTLRISGIDKNLNKDTKISDNGSIVSDKSLMINSIKFDSINMGHSWVNSLQFVDLLTLSSKNFSGFYQNGYIEFCFSFPIIDWIITEKFILPEYNQDQNTAIFGGADKFKYPPLQEKIKKIKNLLND